METLGKKHNRGIFGITTITGRKKESCPRRNIGGCREADRGGEPKLKFGRNFENRVGLEKRSKASTAPRLFNGETGRREELASKGGKGKGRIGTLMRSPNGAEPGANQLLGWERLKKGVHARGLRPRPTGGRNRMVKKQETFTVKRT